MTLIQLAELQRMCDMLQKEIEQLKKEIIKDLSIFQSEWMYVKFQALYGKIAKLFISTVESNQTLEQLKGQDDKIRAFKLMKYIERKYIKDSDFLESITTLWDLANKIKHDTLQQEFDQSLTQEEMFKGQVPNFEHFAKESIFMYNGFIEKLHRKTTVIEHSFKIDETFLVNDLISTLSDKVVNGNTALYEQQLHELEWKFQNTQAKFAELDEKISTISSQKKEAIILQKKIKQTKEKKLQTILSNDLERVDFTSSKSERISIVCGNGKQDYGFYVDGIPYDGSCCFPYPSIYATIHNFLQRASNIEKSTFLKERETLLGRDIHFKVIYRYEMLLLLFIRYGLVEDNTIIINVPLQEQTDVELAFSDIVHYAQLLAQFSKIQFVPPTLIFSDEGEPLSLFEEAYGISIVDYTTKQSTTRQIWFENNMRYCIELEDEPQLNLLLKDFFQFESFKPGQFEILKEILNEETGAICLLPTGGGKSLIFYFVALLSPCPSIVVTPTPILIKDQIRNLQAFHGIDDVIEISTTVNYNNLPLTNKFIFLTPGAFQEYTLIFDIIRLNVEQKIANVFLDEVHEISNWSHQFKPEYLMLSFNMLTYIDKTKWFAFTATANYKVIQDILNQLRLNKDKIISPIELTRQNIHFKFNPKSSQQQVIQSISQVIETDMYALQQQKQRYLIFTKNEEVSKRIVEQFPMKLKNITDVYQRFEMNSYQDFAEGKTAILVADKDLGVGINIPDVTNVIHSGFPISKSQFVQEIGRTGRDGEQAHAQVYFVSKEHMSHTDKSLLNFNTSIDEVIKLLKEGEDNDLIQVYRNILGHVEELEKSVENILDIYAKIANIDNYAIVRFQLEQDLDHEEQLFRIQSYLYVLYRIGYIYNWFIMPKESGQFVEFYIEIEEDVKLTDCQKKLNQYFDQIGEYHKNSYAIKRAASHKELIYLYQEWYYHEFLYHHREQLLNVINFFEYYADKSNEAIHKDLANYFSISVIGIEESIDLVMNSSVEQMLEKIKVGIDEKLVADLHKAIEYQYNSRIDTMLLLYELFIQKNYNHSRFVRVMTSLDPVDYSDFCNSLYLLYSQCTLAGKFQIINELLTTKTTVEAFELIYTRCKKDLIYYGVMADLANSSLKGETVCLTT